ELQLESRPARRPPRLPARKGGGGAGIGVGPPPPPSAQGGPPTRAKGALAGGLAPVGSRGGRRETPPRPRGRAAPGSTPGDTAWTWSQVRQPRELPGGTGREA